MMGLLLWKGSVRTKSRILSQGGRDLRQTNLKGVFKSSLPVHKCCLSCLWRALSDANANLVPPC